ncbi:Sec20-domain-containing protein [Tricladium varicosporioides]|nr:Sec20-domain-containing protein [Hymenoscyphus varicosporioides]
MSFEAVSERLAALQDSNVQLRDLINRLTSIKFQPGSVPVESEEGNAITELTLEIQQTIKDQDEDFEILQEEVCDLNSGRPDSELRQNKDSLNQAVKRAIKELQSCQSAFRKAQLIAKRNLVEAQKAERELLLQSYLSPPSDSSSPTSPVPFQQRRRVQQNVELSKEEREVNASSDVTAALRRTHDMMASELSRSQFAHDTLKESTAALAQLSETYSTLDTLLSSSRNLLGTLLRSQKSDTWYLETAFYVLLVTIGWLIFRRILYGPTWWLIWFPMKMFIKGWMGFFAVTGLTGSSSASVSELNLIATPSLVVHGSATGRLSAPAGAGPPGGAHSINVGGGGRGAPMRPGETITEQVGRIIDESNSLLDSTEEDPIEKPADEGAGDVEERSMPEESNEPRNPKKRIWEEEIEAAKEEQRKKNEL